VAVATGSVFPPPYFRRACRRRRRFRAVTSSRLVTLADWFPCVALQFRSRLHRYMAGAAQSEDCLPFIASWFQVVQA
jgi:hypothetical protein